MRLIHFIILALCCSGCWSYHRDTPPINYPEIPTLTESRSDVSENRSDIYRDLQQQWQQSLPGKTFVEHSLYDFDSAKSKQLRSLATSPQKLPKEVSLDLLLCLAYERNPGLKDKLQRWQAVQERYTQAFFLQNLLDQYSSFTRTLNTQVGMQYQQSEISQSTPFPGFLSLLGKVIITEEKIAQQHYIMALRDLIHQITHDYAAWIYSQKAIHIQQQHLEIVESLEVTARDKFRAGLASYGDVLKAQILKAKIIVDVKTFEETENALQIKLLTALDLPITQKLNAPRDVNFQKFDKSLQNLYGITENQRQEIKIVQLQGEKVEHMINLAKDRLYPDFTIGMSYFENRNAERITSGKQAEAFPDTRMNMPKFSFGQRDSYIREMQIERQALAKKLAETKQNTTAQTRNLFFQVDKHWREYKLYKDNLIPLAEESLKVTRTNYQAGKNADFLDVLDAERTLLSFALELEQHRKNYLQSLADLEQVSGTKLYHY